jgi:hypothetical protein
MTQSLALAQVRVFGLQAARKKPFGFVCALYYRCFDGMIFLALQAKRRRLVINVSVRSLFVMLM